jgi:hypothetical protein
VLFNVPTSGIYSFHCTMKVSKKTCHIVPHIGEAPPIKRTDVSCKQKTGSVASKEARTKCQRTLN